MKLNNREFLLQNNLINCFVGRVQWITVVLFLALSLGVTPFYHGNVFLYVTFVVIFAFLLWDSLDRNCGWFYTFLSIFLVFGFPVKLGYHLFTGDIFNEPVGSFSYTGDGYDSVILAVTTGVAGVLLGKFLFGVLSGKFYKQFNNSRIQVPITVDYLPWFVVILTLGLVIVNYEWGFFHLGMVPATVLPYHLTSLVFWAFNFGVLFFLAYSLNASPNGTGATDRKVALILVVFFLVGCSIYSRAPLLLLAGPLLAVTVYKGFRFLSLRRIGFYFTAWVLCIGISFVCVSYLRAYNFFHVETPHVETYIGQFGHLFIDRWVGFEGVASVSSYPPKGWPLFRRMLDESSSTQGDGLYAKISKSPFLGLDDMMKKTMLVGGIPGLFAVLLTSGDSWVVFFGSFLMIFTILMLERFFYVLVGFNTYLIVVVGCMVARTVVSFSYVDTFWRFMLELMLTVGLYVIFGGLF